MKPTNQKLTSYLITLTVFSGIAVAGWFYVGSLLRRPTSLKTSDVLMSISTPSSYDQPLIIKLAGQILSISPLGASAAEAQTGENNIIKYIDAFVNTDIVQTRYFNKIKEDIILKQPGHPAEFAYQLNLSAYDFSKNEKGDFLFYQKGHSGDEFYLRFTIPAPFMIDAAGRISSTADVETILTSGGKLNIKPSAQWLAQAKYPVTLDPTIEINVLTVHAHPQQGQNWTVEFTTQGQADLKIIPNDQATIDDDEFTGLFCGQQKMEPQILTGDVIYYPNWSCAETATVVHYTKKAGNHTLRFEFGGQIAYAYNSASTASVVFRSPEQCGTGYTVADIEGNIYNTVKIGTQCWMASNMMTTKYPDGSAITRGAVDATWDGTDHSYYAYPPNIGNTAEESLGNIQSGKLGFVYQWSAAVKSGGEGAQGICPTGWHVPTDAEYIIMEESLGMCSGAGAGCSGATGWRGTDQGSQLSTETLSGTNSSGFTAHLAGYRSTDGTFVGRTGRTILWSSTPSGGAAWYRYLNLTYATVSRDGLVNPMGFSVRCLKNTNSSLPSATGLSAGAGSVFSTDTYTGTGAAKTITNGINLSGQGGMVWIKDRGATNSNGLFDTVNTATKYLKSDATTALTTTADTLTAFNTTGFTFGADATFTGVNKSSDTYVAWTFRKAPKFFDVETFTTDGSGNATVPHYLGVIPGVIITKNTSTIENWHVYHTSLGTANSLWLNSTNGAAASAAVSSLSSVSFTATGLNSNQAHVAYLFADDPSGDGIIRVGSYTGNGSVTGPSVNLGWTPQWLMIKNASATGNWQIMDTKRGMGRDNDAALKSNSSAVESSSGRFVKLTGTGFQIASTSPEVNTINNTYVFLAIREEPAPAVIRKNTIFRDVAPTTIGQQYGGGYYAGNFSDGGKNYYLIAAPKITGEIAGKSWGTFGVNTGITSTTAGPTNSVALAALGSAYEAAVWAEALNIGGHADWYLPAIDEVEVLYQARTAFAVVGQDFTAGPGWSDNWYWSSTELASGNARCIFFAGHELQSYQSKNNIVTSYVRAVRRVLIR